MKSGGGYMSGFCGGSGLHDRCKGGWGSVACVCQCHVAPVETDVWTRVAEARVPEAWRPIFDAWLAEETDILDFQGHPIPERLQLLLEVLNG